jgi:hypothetical protein
VIGLQHVVQVLRDEQREFFFGVDVDHGAVAQWPIEPDTHRAVHRLPHCRRRFLILVTLADEYPHMDLVLSLGYDDLADSTVAAAERDSQLEFADIPLPKAKRVAEALRVAIRTPWPHLRSVANFPRS